jgi:putative flippase GtrA
VVTGGVAAGVNFAARIFFSLWLSYSFAIVLAYLLGMITAFALAKVFVFKGSAQTLSKSIFFFIVVNLVAIFQTWIVSLFFSRYALPYFGVIMFKDEIAHAIGIVVPIFTSYYGHKRFSFRS